MKLKFGSDILSSYKRLSYTAWYALAEFVDNSTQAYFNNKTLLDQAFQETGESLTIKIDYGNSGQEDYIKIEDNSIGMNEAELAKALTIGLKPENQVGRSKYGLGLKTAAFWFGDTWSIQTKKFGETVEYFVELNIEDLIQNPEKDLELNKKVKLDPKLHYTIVRVTQLNRRIVKRTSSKVREYLRSIYRNDFADISLKLYLNGEQLTWDKNEILNRLIKVGDSLVKRDFSFIINGKKVSGWAGVFEKGSRKDAGFSIIQAGRVIKGWPDSYRPEKLFGYQEGGSNDLVNQRLVGELYMDGFEVSHTKDTILFMNEEEEELGDSLVGEIGDLRQMAIEYRKTAAKEVKSMELEIKLAVDEVLREINSEEFIFSVNEVEVLPDVIIEEGNTTLIKKVIEKKIMPELETTIGSLKVIVFFDEDSSINDPYLVTRSRARKDEVLVLINRNHPYWRELSDSESIYQFVKHCIFDGIAEWKAYFRSNTLNPDTIKSIKDQLLRIPFELDKAAVRGL